MLYREAGSVSADRRPEPLRIELLGGFRVTCGAREIPGDGWRLAKARSLVKILALAPGQSLLRDQLIELLWPELDPEAGANNLHQVLHVARRTLAGLVPGTKPNAIIRLRRGVLSLDPPTPLWVDVAAFERRAAELASSGDPADFYPALDLYRGDLLPDDLYEEWAADRRTALRELYLDLLDRLAVLHAERREATPAIDALRRLVAIEPDREEAHRALMELYALTGRRQQALRQFERVREILERELEIEPEPETDELYAAILSGDYPTETWETEVPPDPVAAPRPEITESIAEFLGRAGDFVGRGEELGKLQRALERVVGGRGQIILIAGEPGIGKTRMSEEFLRYAGAQGVRTLWGRCYEGDGAPAYWPWVQIVRAYLDGRATAELRTVMGAGAADIARIAPELRERLPDLPEPPPLDPDGERFRLFDSMATFLKRAAARAPLALIIDDLHSADRSSLLLLEFLAREIPTTGLLIVGTYRHVEVDRGHPLTRTLGQLARHDANERITLDGLSVADIERYILLVTGQAVPAGLAAAVHDQTEGNPFFVREIVALLMEEERLSNPEDVRSWRLTIPHGIRETIALRTARLSDTAHRVLTTASVSGRDFELSIVARVAGLDELDTLDALEEALATGLVVESPPTPGGFRFTHAIAREILYDELSHSRRLRMHLLTGEAIQAIAADQINEHLSDVAYHFAAAAPVGAATRAIEYLQLAAAQAASRVAYAEACDYLRRAVDIHLEHFAPDDEGAAELLLRLGDALTRAGESVEAHNAYARAAEIARRLGDSRRLARAAIGTFDAGYYSAYWYSPFINLLEESLSQLQEEDLDLKVPILSRLATALQNSPESNERMRQISVEAVELAIRRDDPEELPFALYARLLAHWSPENDASVFRDATELLEAAQRISDTRMTLIGHAWRIHYFLESGALAEADQEINRYGSLAIASRQPQYLWADQLRRTMRLIAQGSFEEAEVSAIETRSRGQRSWPGPADANFFQQFFVIRREQDRLVELGSDIQGLIAEYPHDPLWRCIQALIHLETGDMQSARGLFNELRRSRFDDIPRDWFWLANLAILSEICAELGASAEAESLYRLLRPFDGRLICPGTDAVCLGPVSYYLGLLARTMSNAACATRYFEACAAQSASLGFWPWLGYARLRHAEVIARESVSNPEAVRLLECAADIAERCGMPRLRRLVNGLPAERSAIV